MKLHFSNPATSLDEYFKVVMGTGGGHKKWTTWSVGGKCRGCVASQLSSRAPPFGPPHFNVEALEKLSRKDKKIGQQV